MGISMLVPSTMAQVMASWPMGFANLNSVPPYEYGPSIILLDKMYYQFYCSPGSGNVNEAWDYIRMTTSTDGVNWSAPVIALAPNNKYNRNSVCDPSVVRFKGVYYLYHTCINVEDPPDGYKNNRICVALADKITGPYYTLSKPVFTDFTCPSDDSKAYCVGQPSAVNYNQNKIYLYFTNQKPGEPGPNSGYVELAISDDGITFTQVTNDSTPSYSQRDVDVKYDRAGKRFVMMQGDVGGPNITWATSTDGLIFTPYSGSRNVLTNPSLPHDGTNNNPGVAGLPDGSMGYGSSFVAYGSSYQAGWGYWHLYRTDFALDPQSNDCHGCAQPNCDFACSVTLGKTATGICKFPGSKDGGHCCECTPFQNEPDCSACEPVGCVAGCRGAGYDVGICGIPGSTNPNLCCSCLK